MQFGIENNHKIRLGLCLISLFALFNVQAQVVEEEDEIDLLLDELFFNEEELLDEILRSFGNYSFLYTNLSFNSDTYFSGRQTNVDQFNFVPQISYYDKSGLYLSLSGIYYSEFNPTWDYTNLSLGYHKAIGKNGNFHYGLGYTRYFFTDGYDIFTNSLDLSLGIRSNSKTVGTEVFASFLFGNDESFQLVSRTYARLPLVKNSNIRLSFRPALRLIMAKQTYGVRVLTDADNIQEPEIIFQDVFAYLNTQLSFPVSLTTKSWDIELGYHLNLPTPLENESELDSTGYFNVSLGYLIDFSGNR